MVAARLFTSAFLKETPWGGISFVALAVSVLSGVSVALQYQAAEPFFSVVSMDLLAPYGRFLRSLHFYSSQVFLFFMVFHLIAVVWAHEKTVSLPEWTRLVSLLPLTLLLLFTGYVLRGDGTGRAAGIIAENISKSVPYVGELVNTLLFNVSGSGLKRVYAQHLAGLCILFGWAGWNHLRRYPLQWIRWGWVVCLMLAWSFFVAAPLEQARLGQPHMNGPWFFIGVQELLRYYPVFFAGIFFPVLGIVPLLFLQPGNALLLKKSRWIPLACMWTWLGLYFFLTVFGFLRDIFPRT